MQGVCVKVRTWTISADNLLFARNSAANDGRKSSALEKVGNVMKVLITIVGISAPRAPRK